MGLDSFKTRTKDSIERLNDPELCPVCGTDDTEEKHYYRVCNDGNCDVVTYQPTDYSISL